MLFHEYQVAPEDMARDFPVKVGLDGKTRNKKVDIAVFAPGADHTEASLRRVVVCKQEPKRGKNVVKLRDLAQMKTEQAELEALLGAEDFPERRHGMWTDNVDFFFIEKESGRFGATYHQRADWPLADGTVGSGQVASAQQLRRAEPEMLKITFRRCHNYIHGNEGMPKDAAFWQFLYLLFAKMYDERAARDGIARRFYTTMTEPYEEAGRAAIRGRILDLFEDVKQRYAASGLSATATRSPSPSGRWPSSSASWPRTTWAEPILTPRDWPTRSWSAPTCVATAGSTSPPGRGEAYDRNPRPPGRRDRPRPNLWHRRVPPRHTDSPAP